MSIYGHICYYLCNIFCYVIHVEEMMHLIIQRRSETWSTYQKSRQWGADHSNIQNPIGPLRNPGAARASDLHHLQPQICGTDVGLTSVPMLFLLSLLTASSC